MFSQALLAVPEKQNEVSGLMIMGLFGGTVQVSLDEQGGPQYEIKTGVAWDNIISDCLCLTLCFISEIVYICTVSEI